MGLGWFDAIASAATPVMTGLANSRLAIEEDRRKQEEEMLRNQLLQAQIGYYGRGRDEWKPTTQAEATAYELGIHPERTAKPEGSTPQSEWGKAGFPETPEGQDSYLKYLARKTRTEYPERFSPGQPKDPAGPQAHSSFLQAYLQRTQSGHLDQDTQQWQDPPPATQRLDDAEAAWQRIVALQRGETAAPAAMAAPQQPQGSIFSLMGRSQDALGGGQGPGPQKRTITQDQADYLRAINQWDPALYEVR